MGLTPYIKKYVNENFRDYTLIPVPVSRIFRHRNIFVHSESGIEKPDELKNRCLGTPTFGASANTWIRGFLKDEYGVEADDLDWIETTESSDAADLQGVGSGGNSFNADGTFANLRQLRPVRANSKRLTGKTISLDIGLFRHFQGIIDINV